MFGEKPQINEAMVKMINPQLKIFLRPQMSASLPKGTRKTAADSKKDVATQLKVTAFAENSLPIAGNAIFVAEPINGVTKAAKEVTIKVALSKDLVLNTFIFRIYSLYQ